MRDVISPGSSDSVIDNITISLNKFLQFVGHELIVIVVGIVWGLWVGFAITSAGTLIGEIANYLYALCTLHPFHGGQY